MTHRIETISSPAMTLEVLPDLGASVLGLRAASGRPVLREVDPGSVETSSQCASFTLLPYSNRIRDARFTFGGGEVQLRVTTKDGLTQHGDVRNRPWQVTRVSDSHLGCDFDSRAFPDVNWPWAFTARVDYFLHGPHLDVSVTLTNADTSEMPAGLGLHPYFARRQGGEDPRLTVDAALTYDTDERSLPTGPARPVRPEEDYRTGSAVGERKVDRVYTAWDGVARLDWQDRSLTLTADAVFSHLVVFTAPDGSLALEPVSHVTDAFNLAARGVPGVDMRTLAPGQSLAGAARITLEGNW
ncbi:aldose 1-epimerase [Deinococcus aetherius]|uniref:Aldose 1-epimerase n=1 Tax=Deinococcus aetherius TaxID=200252 RepID=A0ABN6RIZ5_9DEIO|nr:aldose 1-epimerase [Deinococcus aetherius]BDP42829.1 aldose 1-epimerase [Deinococcus aetherius]